MPGTSAPVPGMLEIAEEAGGHGQKDPLDLGELAIFRLAEEGVSRPVGAEAADGSRIGQVEIVEAQVEADCLRPAITSLTIARVARASSMDVVGEPI